MVNAAAITGDQLAKALEVQLSSGGYLGEILVALGFITPAKLKPYLEEVTGFPFIDLSETDFDPELASRLPEAYATSKQVLVFGEQNGNALVAMADPVNVSIVDDLRAKLQKPVLPYLALFSDIELAIRRTYDVRSRTKNLIAGLGEHSDSEVASVEEATLADEAARAPIVRLVTEILTSAMASGASDIHLEPQEDEVRVRFRIDGVLCEQMTIPLAHLSATVSRLKVMSLLDIAERRRPQDGRFTSKDEHVNEYDVRLSMIPTVYGEKACMRLLEKANSKGKIEKLGFLPEQQKLFEKFIKRPHGLVLVTGPTGSGKSTTLYAALQRINDPAINISTIEDPVEYKLRGINQTQVNPKIGVTFSNGLRSLVRQDPDVILVGEIRDRDTAEIAIQAALTGHLVLSSLHTVDAVGAVVRLQNMGVESFLVSSAVVGVVGQRLLRTICPHCRDTFELPDDARQTLGLDSSEDAPLIVARGTGCKRCEGRGVKGRTAVMEVLPLSENLRKMILEEGSDAAITHQAISEGFISMRRAAGRKALELIVSPDEIVRVFAENE